MDSNLYEQSLREAVFEIALLTDFTLDPKTKKSNKFRTWVTQISINTCYLCLSQNGKVFFLEDHIEQSPPVHENCRCAIEAVISIVAGSATIHKENGADYYLRETGQLPENYVSKEDATKKGWRSYKGNLSTILPGYMISGGVFNNKEGKLPNSPGRLWFEADINYTDGFRNRHRVLFSSDGLIFVTYNHYESFYEIV